MSATLLSTRRTGLIPGPAGVRGYPGRGALQGGGPPSGPAGGALSGTYPNPTLAVTPAVGWQTALDLDFTAKPSQDFFVDVTSSFAGMTWTKLHSVMDATTANVGGTGLQFRPAYGLPNAPVNGAPVTYPMLWLPFAQVPSLAAIAPDWPMRFSFRVLGTGTTASGALMAFPGSPAAWPWFAAYKIPVDSFGVSMDVPSAGGGAAYADASEYANSDVVVMEWPAGVQTLSATVLVGAYAGGWPANTTLLPAASTTTFSNGSLGSGGRVNTWGVSLGAWWVAGATPTPPVTFTHLRIEYLQR